MLRDRVAALNVADVKLLPLLENGETHEKIKEFATEDEVFSLLASGEPGSYAQKACFEGGARGDKDEDENSGTISVNPAPCATLRFCPKIKHVYQKAGIYFSLLSQLKYMSTASNRILWQPRQTNIILTYGVGYRPKCGSTYLYTTGTTSETTKTSLERRFYEGSTGLQKYVLSSNYEWENKGWDPTFVCDGSMGSEPRFITVSRGQKRLRTIQDNW
ncbi:hypothetical protein GCM10022406_01040 [Hymenobacter algoricola]|uniref:Uncharacterized protein n=2 Tax=Hymenobacter algoricola TaxID=486267 RepID=A0ABP7MDT8_9BACT